VNENTIFELNGIDSQPVFTIGSIILRVQLGTEETTVTFQVVYENFPISKAGILDSPFFKKKGISINFKTSTLSTDFSENSEPPEFPDLQKTFIIQPWSETLVPIIIDKEDGITLILHSQNIGGDGILVGNVVNSVEKGRIVILVVNPSENPVKFLPTRLDSVQYDIFEGGSVHLSSRTKGQPNKEN